MKNFFIPFLRKYNFFCFCVNDRYNNYYYEEDEDEDDELYDGSHGLGTVDVIPSHVIPHAVAHLYSAHNPVDPLYGATEKFIVLAEHVPFPKLWVFTQFPPLPEVSTQ